MRSEQLFGEFDYEAFLKRIENGEIIEDQSGFVEGVSPLNSLTNNNAGSTGTGFFTQSETTLVAFGNTVVVGFNDSGSNSGGTNKFTGFARSTDGGATFTDGGTLPTNPVGDAGDPVLARNNTTGRLYFSTLGFSAPAPSRCSVPTTTAPPGWPRSTARRAGVSRKTMDRGGQLRRSGQR